jgi:hypothetical protein
MFKDGKAVFKIDKYGMIDKEGNFVITPQYDALRTYHHGYAAACLNGLWGFIDETGNVAIEFKYDYVSNFDDNGNAHVELNGQTNSINLRGEQNGEWLKIDYHDPYGTADNIIDEDYIQDGLREAFGGNAHARWNVD